jgi:hypothetical protein
MPVFRGPLERRATLPRRVTIESGWTTAEGRFRIEPFSHKATDTLEIVWVSLDRPKQ